MTFKKDKDGNLVLDKSGNPIAINENGETIDLNATTVDPAEVVASLAKKFGVKLEQPKGKEFSEADITKIVTEAVQKARTEEKDKLHNRLETTKQKLEGKDEELASFKAEILETVKVAVGSLAEQIKGVQQSVTQTSQAQSKVQLSMLKDELIKKSNGQVIEELVTGDTQEELLANYKIAVEAFKKYAPKKDAAGQSSQETTGANSGTQEQKTAQPYQAPADLQINIPEEFAATPYDKLPPEVKKSVDDQFADYMEKHPEEKKKFEQTKAPAPEQKTGTQNEPKLKPYTALPTVVNVAREVLTGSENGIDFNSSSMADPDNFQANWAKSRDAALKNIEQLQNNPR